MPRETELLIAVGLYFDGLYACDVTLLDQVFHPASSLFDVYEGKGVPEGQKSIAIAVTLQPRDRTLAEADLEAVSRKIVEAVAKKTGGTLRS